MDLSPIKKSTGQKAPEFFRRLGQLPQGNGVGRKRIFHLMQTSDKISLGREEENDFNGILC